MESPGDELVFCFFLHIAQESPPSVVHSQPQFPTLFIDVFAMDVNADKDKSVIETLAGRAVFVAQTSAVCAPTVNPLSKSLGSFSLAILIRNQNQLDLQNSFTSAREDTFSSVSVCGLQDNTNGWRISLLLE